MLKLLGYGTYGRVFLAKKKDNGKIYAIKVLDKKNLSKHKQTDLTKLEKKILKSIKSRFLIKLYYAFQSNTKLFLVIEYCPGGELYFYLKVLRYFHEKTVKFYTLNILLGLKALHDNDIGKIIDISTIAPLTDLYSVPRVSIIKSIRFKFAD